MRVNITSTSDPIEALHSLIELENPHRKRLADYEPLDQIQRALDEARKRLVEFKAKSKAELEKDYADSIERAANNQRMIYDDYFLQHERAKKFEAFIVSLKTNDDEVDAAIERIFPRAEQAVKNTHDQLQSHVERMNGDLKEEITFEDWYEAELLWRESRVGKHADEYRDRKMYERVVKEWNDKAFIAIARATAKPVDDIPF